MTDRSIVLWFAYMTVVFMALISMEPALAAEQSTPVADGSPSFAITNSEGGENPYFSVEVDPGKSSSLVAAVKSLDSAPVDLVTYATNAVNPPNGGFDATPATGTVEPPATWIEYPERTFSLEGTESIEFPFEVNVPANAKPGQYVAALVAETAEPLPVSGTNMINVNLRSLIAVEILVPGKRTVSFQLGNPEIISEAGTTTLSIPIENTGNYRVRPQGGFTLTDQGGTVVTDAPIVMGSVYGGNSTTIEFDLPPQFSAGDYTLSGSVEDPDSGYSAEIESKEITYAPSVDTYQVNFTVDPVAITPVGDPIQFADISITVNNDGDMIPTGKVELIVKKDDELVEEFVLSQNQAMPQGSSTITARYIPASGWESGTYSFEIVIYSVDDSGVASIISTTQLSDTIEVP